MAAIQKKKWRRKEGRRKDTEKKDCERTLSDDPSDSKLIISAEAGGRSSYAQWTDLGVAPRFLSMSSVCRSDKFSFTFDL